MYLDLNYNLNVLAACNEFEYKSQPAYTARCKHITIERIFEVHLATIHCKGNDIK
jgi:hypothetical protein